MTKPLAIVQPRPSRLSTKLRCAIELRVREGKTITEACAEAGMSSQGWHKAMKRPAVRDHLEEVQRRFVAEVDSKRAFYKAWAYEIAMELLETATSESTKVRLIEFLAGDGKAPQVAVHVDARQGGAYEYARPGQRVVEIESVPVSQEGRQERE